MIRYALRCERGHDFEGWFRDSSAFDLQAETGEVACPTCGSDRVEKSLMAPAVAKPTAEAPKRQAPAEATHALAADPKAQALVEAVRRLRRHVVENADYVGPRFADEARKIHHEEAERRDIYGEASVEETKALLEDGIEILPLPALPEEQN